MSVKCQSSVSKVLIKMSIKGIDYHFKMDDPRSEWEGSPCYVVDSEQHITTNHLTFRGLAVTLIYLMQDHVTCSKYPIKPSFVNFFLTSGTFMFFATWKLVLNEIYNLHVESQVWWSTDGGMYKSYSHVLFKHFPTINYH